MFSTKESQTLVLVCRKKLILSIKFKFIKSELNHIKLVVMNDILLFEVNISSQPEAC